MTLIPWFILLFFFYQKSQKLSNDEGEWECAWWWLSFISNRIQWIQNEIKMDYRLSFSNSTNANKNKEHCLSCSLSFQWNKQKGKNESKKIVYIFICVNQWICFSKITFDSVSRSLSLGKRFCSFNWIKCAFSKNAVLPSRISISLSSYSQFLAI